MFSKIYAAEIMMRGGKWLGAARNWIQWNCMNGDAVTWGSHDKLDVDVLDVERMASEVAEAIVEATGLNVIEKASFQMVGFEELPVHNVGHYEIHATECADGNLRIKVVQIQSAGELSRTIDFDNELRIIARI